MFLYRHGCYRSRKDQKARRGASQSGNLLECADLSALWSEATRLRGLANFKKITLKAFANLSPGFGLKPCVKKAHLFVATLKEFVREINKCLLSASSVTSVSLVVNVFVGNSITDTEFTEIAQRV